MAEHSEQLERGRFEGEVLARLDALGQKIDTFSNGQVDHEERLRTIENEQAQTRGKTLALGAVAGGAIQVVSIVVQWLSSK